MPINDSQAPSAQSAGRQWRHRAIILACAVAVSLPLAIRGSSCGHDFDFHLQSWLGVADQWRHGVVSPHWIEAANYGAGEPRLVFYPPFSWMLGALLGVVLPWAAVPTAFTLIVMAACGLSMHRLASEWLSPNAATLAACAYILTPYALFVAYERTAYGELAAAIWLPLIVLYSVRSPRTGKIGHSTARHELAFPSRTMRDQTIRTVSDQSSSRVGDRNILPLALVIAAIWLTNAPAAVMSCYLLAAITLWRSLTERQWQPVLRSVIGLVLGLALAALYLVPAAYERRWVDIARAIGPGMRIQDSYLFGHTGEPFHDQVLRTASWIFVTMLAAIAIAGCVGWSRRAARRLILPLFVTAAVLLALQLPWSDPLWRLAPQLRFLQFPWRWSLVLNAAFALALGAAVTSERCGESGTKFRRYAAAILFSASVILPTATWLFWQPCDDQDAVSAQVALFRSGAGFEGTDEYTTLGADNSLIEQSLPPVRILNAADTETAASPASADQDNPPYTPVRGASIPAQLRIERWQPEHKTFTVIADAPGFAVLRLMDYPAWQVRANAAVVALRPHRDDGLMTIPVTAGVSRIDIVYHATPDIWWGRGISAASLVVLLGLFAAGRNRGRQPKTRTSRIS